MRARAALSKLFRSEQAGDARYVVVALGTTTELVQGPTTDPATVLKAIESKDFEKLFLGDKKGTTGLDIQAFRRELDVARRACDEGSARMYPAGASPCRSEPPRLPLRNARSRPLSSNSFATWCRISRGNPDGVRWC